MTGAARNTVRRFQREGHHGRAWRAIEANLYCGWLIKTKINEAINYFRDEASGYL